MIKLFIIGSEQTQVHRFNGGRCSQSLFQAGIKEPDTKTCIQERHDYSGLGKTGNPYNRIAYVPD